MIENINVKYSRFAYTAARLMVVIFAFLSVLDDLAQRNMRVFFISTAFIAAAFFLVIILHHLNRFIHEAFSTPAVCYLMWLAAALTMKNFPYFFPACLAITCMGALYLEERSLLGFIILSNIISAILIIFKIPVVKIENGVTVSIPFTEVLVTWFFSLFGSVCVFIGVTYAAKKNKTAKKAQASFASLLKSTRNRIALMDSMNRVTYISAPLLEMARLENADRAVGRPIFDLFSSTEFNDMIYDLIKKGDFYEGTREVETEGETCYFDVITSKLSDGTGGWLLNMIDITPVMKAKFEAEAASQSKSAFLATMSHEIRTPLNAILGLSEIELQKKLPDEIHRALEKIHSSGASLLAIINDVLDISKIEAGSFELVPVDYDVPSMINDTVHLNIVRIGSKHIVFKLEIDETIPMKLFGDELRVKQILNNLLSNAFKYTEAGKVCLKIAWEKRDGNAWITFVVSDTGRGMRKEDLPRIFSEYRQLDAKANRHIEGTGLGLSITRNLVNLMRGTIKVESEYGKGSAFTVQIPQRIIDESPIGEVTARNLELFRFRDIRHSRGLRLVRTYMPYGRVLVVDDVETNLDVVRGLLLPYGLDISCAASGAEAIEKIRAAGTGTDNPRFDLVLMDHMMPEMDGIEAVRIIRNEIDSDYARTVPIIALTANALTGNEKMFLSNGFNAYISKPIDIMQLDVALNTWVRNKQSSETLIQAEMEKAMRSADDAEELPGVLEGLLVDGIDLALGRERYNDEAAYLDILRSYRLHTPALLEKLRVLADASALSPEALGDYAVVIHGLKGSSYGICANEAGRQAEELELAAKAGDSKRVLEGSGPFIEMTELMLLDLDELLKKTAGSKENKRRAAAPDSAQLEKLLDAAKRYKSTLMEEAVTELESCEYESGGELVVWLREQLDNLEYDAIRERLESLSSGSKK